MNDPDRTRPAVGAATLAARLARRATDGVLVMPGCWDPLTLLLVEQAGFPAAFVSGAALTMASMGLPDLGYITGPQIVSAISAMRSVSDLPLVVDGDTGFGNALTLGRFIRGVERAGASAVQIEDQVYPKRCGHLQGKRVVPIDQAVSRVRAALDAREDMLIVARTDALGLDGLEAALERAGRFVEEGADVVFVEGGTLPQLGAIGAALGNTVPLIHNMVEGGGSPVADAAELGRLGFAVALNPLVLMHGLVGQGRQWLDVLARTGSTRTLAGTLADLHALNVMLGTADHLQKGEFYDC